MTICSNAGNTAGEARGLSRLSRLADAAARTVPTRDGEIALVREDGPTPRRQAGELRSEMQRRGTRSVDLTGPHLSDADRLAAHLSVPLFTLDESGAAGPRVPTSYSRSPGSPEFAERDAISLSARHYRDVVLSRVTVAPCGPEPAALDLLVNGHDPLRLDDTEISARLRNRCLEVCWALVDLRRPRSATR